MLFFCCFVHLSLFVVSTHDDKCTRPNSRRVSVSLQCECNAMETVSKRTAGASTEGRKHKRNLGKTLTATRVNSVSKALGNRPGGPVREEVISLATFTPGLYEFS